MTPEQLKAVMKEFSNILDEDIVWFAYHKEEPVGFFVMLPEMNQIFRHVNGKLDLPGILQFLWHRQRRTCTKMFGLVFRVRARVPGQGPRKRHCGRRRQARAGAGPALPGF
jgi:hypothetical protein